MTRPAPVLHATGYMRALGIEGSLPVPVLVTGTDRVAFMHEKLVRRLGHLPGVRVLPSPFTGNPSRRERAVSERAS